MVTVEGGVFTQASYQVSRKVRLSTFKICKYQVTQAQWKAIMGTNPSHFKGDDLPVENVSWDDAQEFIKKLNAKTGKHYALPTEAQWEFAARGGNKSHNNTYAGCDSENRLGGCAWYEKNSFQTTNPVGKKKPNELGLYDMSGNVWEWCEDWYQKGYPIGDIADPKGPSSGQFRVLRGGSWGSSAGSCRVSNRIDGDPSRRYININSGLRLVLLP